MSYFLRPTGGRNNIKSGAEFAACNGRRPAAYDKMLWKSIVDSAPRVAAISGAKPDAQVVENIPAANADQLRRAGRTVEFADGGNNLYLMFNTALPAKAKQLLAEAGVTGLYQQLLDLISEQADLCKPSTRGSRRGPRGSATRARARRR